MAGSIVPNPTASRPLTGHLGKPMDPRRNPSRMETFDPTGSCCPDRQCEHRQVAGEDAALVAIRWFEEIGLTDVALVGGKGANLHRCRPDCM